MIKLLALRLAQAGFVAWAVGTITFVMMKLLPGDMAYRIAASRYGYDFVNQEAAQAVSAELGLSKSPFEQYLSWLSELLRGDLGVSLISGEPISEMLELHLGYSVILAGVALGISLLIAFPLGIYCAKYPNSVIDKMTLSLSILFRSAPVFVIGLVLIIVFALQFGLLPVSGFGQPQHVVLPALALALTLAALSNQMIKNEAISVFRSPFLKFARYKGLSEQQAYERHARINIMLPMFAFIGVQAVGLIEGIVMIESLFSWPGIGHALSHAVFGRDIPMIQGAALVMGLLFVLINTIVDVTQYLIDPRVRQRGRV